MQRFHKCRRHTLIALTLLVTFGHVLAQQPTPTEKDASPHAVRFVEVDKGVKLEVLDWGGSGRPLVFLAGLGRTAHDFDEFALKFIPDFHVYGITRRGFGASSAPPPANGNYSADRLGDDVLAVIDALGVTRPILVGHSIAGQELSSIGSRFPEKISALIYLDAAYGYAYYDAKQGNLFLDSVELKKKLDIFLSANVADRKQFLEELQDDISRCARDVEAQLQKLALIPSQPGLARDPSPIPAAIHAGMQKYTQIRVPALAIFAAPHAERSMMFPNNAAARAALIENDRNATTAQADAFKAGTPSTRVVLLPNASHFVFKSNAAEVEREMKAFLETVH